MIPPLFIITLFCFAMVLLQPHKPSSTRPTASEQSTPTPIGTAPQAEEIPAVSFATAQTLATEPVSATVISTPQQAPLTNTSLQPAGTNNQSLTIKQPSSTQSKTTLSNTSKANTTKKK